MDHGEVLKNGNPNLGPAVCLIITAVANRKTVNLRGKKNATYVAIGKEKMLLTDLSTIRVPCCHI